MKPIGDQLKKARKKIGLSQENLASKLYISKQSISKYENNKSLPSPDIKEKMEDILGVTFSDTSNKHTKFLGLSVLFSILFLLSLSTLIFFYLQLRHDQQVLKNDHQNLETQYRSLNESYLSLYATLQETEGTKEELLNTNASLLEQYDLLIESYEELQVKHQNLQVLYQELIDVKTLSYEGLIITYTGDYEIEGDSLYLDIIIHNTLENGYTLRSDMFDINGETTNASYTVYSEDPEQISQWGYKYIEPGQIYFGRLEATFYGTPNYLSEQEVLSIRFLGQRVAILDLP
jgi:transcriptional regulator with XRE-family HTH domain